MKLLFCFISFNSISSSMLYLYKLNSPSTVGLIKNWKKLRSLQRCNSENVKGGSYNFYNFWSRFVNIVPSNPSNKSTEILLRQLWISWFKTPTPVFMVVGSESNALQQQKSLMVQWRIQGNILKFNSISIKCIY